MKKDFAELAQPTFLQSRLMLKQSSATWAGPMFWLSDAHPSVQLPTAARAI